MAENESWSFQELLVMILRKRRVIVLCALIIAFLFGAFRLVTGWISLTDEAAIESRQQAYEQAVQDYQDEKGNLALALREFKLKLAQIPDEIAILEQKIAWTDEYLENSLLMNLDPTDLCTSSLIVAVSTDYQIMPGMFYQDPDPTEDLVAVYKQAGSSEAVYDAIRERLNQDIPTKYLSELISVEAVGVSFLRISCRFDQIAATEAAVQTVYEQIQTRTAQLADKLGSHRLHSLGMSSSRIIDETLKKKQDSALETLNAIQDKRDEMLKTLEETQKQLDDTEVKLLKLQVPVSSQPSLTGVLSSALQYALLGLFAGAVLTVLLVFINWQMAVCITNSQDIRRLAIRALGTLPPSKPGKRSRIDSWIDRYDLPPDHGSDTQENIRLVKARLAPLIGESRPQKIICIGLCNREKLQAALISLAEAFRTSGERAALLDQTAASPDTESTSGLVLIPADSNLTSARTIETLSGCDLAMLFVSRGETTFNQLQKSAEQVLSTGKPLAGAIIL